MADSLIALGANLGDRHATLDAAVARLASAPGVSLLGRSAWLPSVPVGGPPGQGEFLNGVARVSSNLVAEDLLGLLTDIEAGLGRARRVRWGARPIDLDLLMHDGLVEQSPRLTLPHPRMTFRPFVMGPAADVAPEWVHPVLGATLAALATQLRDGGDWIALWGAPPAARRALSHAALERFSGTAAPADQISVDRIPGDLAPSEQGGGAWLLVRPRGARGGRHALDIPPKLTVVWGAPTRAPRPWPTLWLDPTAEPASWAVELAAAVEAVWPTVV